MKKRILSIALIVAMVVAMIPATLITASAATYDGHYNGYDVYFSETDPTLDGVMDDVYANSETIYSAYNSGSARFEAYFVVTNSGMYTCAKITDSTVDVEAEKEPIGVTTGDYAQIYYQISNTVGDSTQYSSGYYYADVGRAAYYSAQLKYTLTDDGYILETFAPWDYLLNGRITNGFSLETATLKIGYQVNDYGIGDDTHKYICYDNLSCSSYWSGDYSSGANAPAKSMIPANVITAPKAAPNTLKYQSFVTKEDITLDGKRDDVYNLSEKITSKKISVGTYGETTGFETYIVGREDGFYIFASIYDDTLDKAEAVAGGLRNQDGDKFQVYLQLGNNVWNRWGYIDFDYVDGGRHLTTKNTLGYTTDDIQQVATIWEDQKGWDIEIFIPHTISADDRFKGDINASWTDLLMKVNFQALNETCTEWDSTGYCTARNRMGLSYDISQAASAWNGPGHSACYFVPVDFNIDYITTPGTGALTYSDAITLDGVKDASYGDDSLAFVLDKARSSNFTADNGNEYAKAWVTVTGTNVYLYALVNDTTLAASPSDAVVLYTYFPLTDVCIYFGGGYARNGHIEATARWSSDIFLSTNKNETDTSSSIGEGQSMKDLGDGWYAIEFTYSLPYAEKAAIARGETLSIGVGIQHKDRDTSGNINYNRSGYESYWTSQDYTRNSLPRFEVSKASTAANMNVKASVDGANIALGESIAMNYYATLPATTGNAVAKVTMNGKDNYVTGTPTANANEYKFAFRGIAPQCMGDELDAVIYADGIEIGKVEDYSVLQNLENIKDSDNEQIIVELLTYGAAAQMYANYKTDALVNAGYEDLSWVNDNDEYIEANDDRYVDDPLANARFTAAGVYHADANKLYAKLTADDISKVTVTINGKPAVIEEYKYEKGVYIVYSEDVKVLDFGTIYTFELAYEDEIDTQILDYSVYAYAKAKYQAEDPATAFLAKALFAYGDIASYLLGEH